MSATMELAKLSAFFGNCPIFDIPGRLYPVREKFCNLIGPRDRENTAYIQAVLLSNLFVSCVCDFIYLGSLVIYLVIFTNFIYSCVRMMCWGCSHMPWHA